MGIPRSSPPPIPRTILRAEPLLVPSSCCAERALSPSSLFLSSACGGVSGETSACASHSLCNAVAALRRESWLSDARLPLGHLGLGCVCGGVFLSPLPSLSEVFCGSSPGRGQDANSFSSSLCHSPQEEWEGDKGGNLSPPFLSIWGGCPTC